MSVLLSHINHHSTTDGSENLNAITPFLRICLWLLLVVTIRFQKGLILPLADIEMVFGDDTTPISSQTLLHETLAVGC
jgi:hypothetical protein